MGKRGQLGGQVGISMFTVAVERGIVGSNYSQETLRKMALKIRLLRSRNIYIKLYGIFSFFPLLLPFLHVLLLCIRRDLID